MSYIYVFKIELDVRRIGNKNDIEIHKYCLVHYENQLYTTLQNKYFQGNVSLTLFLAILQTELMACTFVFLLSVMYSLQLRFENRCHKNLIFKKI